MLLGEVANLESVTFDDLACVWLVDAGEHAQHRSFSGTVQPDDDNLAALVDS